MHLSQFKRILLCAACLPFLAVAAGTLTQIDNVSLYSEYYLNHTSNFKGTIVFQNGAGTSLNEWTQNSTFFTCVTRYGSAFFYDRSGLGRSPPDLKMTPDKAMTAELINTKFKRLLEKQQIKAPYILVAHSYGAMHAGYFAGKYPKQVKAILMIDPVPPDYAWTDEFLNQYASDIDTMQSMSSQQAYASFPSTNTRHMTAQAFYQIMGFEATKRQISALLPLHHDIPIIIISASKIAKTAPIKGNWYQLQRQWLNANPQSRIVQVDGGHFIQMEHPQFVCQHIGNLLKSQ